ncbi:hypothetical protein [Enterococcus sp. AZ177]|uniref:hypothetical protein n=1 Tax=unclassified Enterococcus TaxID=2608891 RepID=UPI003D2FF2D6
MNKIKTFYGKLSSVEERVNEFLEYLSDNDHQLIDVKQSIDPDAEAVNVHLAITVLYRTKEREQV